MADELGKRPRNASNASIAAHTRAGTRLTEGYTRLIGIGAGRHDGNAINLPWPT
jgi:hypothetical protein